LTPTPTLFLKHIPPSELIARMSAGAAWKAAGLSYNGYLAIASRTLRRCLKPEKAVLRSEAEIKIQKWTNGKASEAELLSRAQATPKAEGASA
jgi:F-type H+-transporting ATPase subunit epsilon